MAYVIIVHPAGELDSEDAASFWTEVPDLPACMGDGGSVDEAVAETRAAIRGWLGQGEEETAPVPLVELDVVMAM